MSDDRFDELAKETAATTSRGQALKLIGGTLVGALFAGAFGSQARAAGNGCLPPGNLCKVNGDCCDTALGNSCCCRAPKFGTVSGGSGICTDREVCLEAGGVCHQ